MKKQLTLSLIVAILLTITTVSFAKPGKHHKRHHFNQEFIELIIQNANIETANQIKAQHTKITQERKELEVLKLDYDRNEKKIEAARKNLRQQRKALGLQIRQMMDNDPALRQLVKEYRKTKHKEHKLFRKIMSKKSDKHFNQLLSVANPDQAQLLKSNKAKLKGLAKGQHKEKHKDYATRQQFKAIHKEQRRIIRAILKQHPDLFAKL